VAATHLERDKLHTYIMDKDVPLVLTPFKP